MNDLVRSRMAAKVIRVEPDCPVLELVKKLRAYRISCVLVCEEDALLGIVSERDVVGVALAALSGQPVPATARELMTPNPTTVTPATPLEEAAETLLEERVRHLPVVDDDGRFAGLLTQTDLLRALCGLETERGSGR
jgi:CBS domain-containing protein